jgi:adenylosuccinate lyase
MARVWEQKNKLDKWLAVELLVCEAWAALGEIPAKALQQIKAQARFEPERVEELEQTIKHDVVAFLTNVGEYLGDNSRYLHLGLTSSDILDTALGMQLREASDIILDDLVQLKKVLKDKAKAYKNLVMIGRTHGIHAEPITLGWKLALWYEETSRNYERMVRAKEIIGYGKISGAVGTFAHVPPRVEEYVCQRCGLKPAPISSQIIQRDRHAEFLSTLAIIATSIDKFATELRHLQRTEVLEAEEFFSEGQKGSSAMPHKRNPITSEQLCGLARLVRSYSLAGLENMPLWHERDISHSSVERVILPDSTILVDYMLNRMTNLITSVKVYPENMEANLRKTHGLIFSQKVLLELAKKGLSREKAYQIVQKAAMATWQGQGEFKDLLWAEPEIQRVFTQEELDKCFDRTYYLRFQDDIFQRVFSQG